MKGHVFVIAEAGVNHNGDLSLALQMIKAAKGAGADAIKFQTFQTDALLSKNTPKADYQKRETGAGESQMEMLRNLELSYNQFRELKAAAEYLGILFLSTPFDCESIEFLDSLNMPLWKIPSGEITNLPYLERIANTKKPIILSTGMCELGEVEDAVNIFLLSGYNREQITLLHCTTEYPAPPESVNLLAMDLLRQKFGTSVGYSDHTEGIDIAIAAVARGAEVLEKHFTLSKTLQGPDHRASLSPDELRQMIKAVRNVELSLGNGEKRPSEQERKNRIAARKSIIAKCSIHKGEKLTEENITTKRPGNGINPMEWHNIIGTEAVRNFSADELIER